MDKNLEKDIVLETLIEHESKIKNVKKKVKRYKEETTDDVNVLNEKIKGVAKDLKNIELTPGDKGKQGDKGDQGERGEDGLNGSKGNDGKQGDCGVKGDKGEQGKDGEEGMDGLDGDIGKDGKMPKHEWNHTSLRFEKKPDIWGKWVDLKGERGTGGMRGSGIDITDVKPLLINFLLKTGDNLNGAPADGNNTLNRWYFNRQSETVQDNAVISVGGTYDGSLASLSYPADTISTQIYGQAASDGSASAYAGVAGLADATRDAAEIYGLAGIAYGAGASGFIGAGGTSGLNINTLGVLDGYADNGLLIQHRTEVGTGLQINTYGTSGTSVGLVIDHDDTADMVQLKDGGTITTWFDGTGALFTDKVITCGVDGLIIDSLRDFWAFKYLGLDIGIMFDVTVDTAIEMWGSVAFAKFFINGSMEFIGATNTDITCTFTGTTNSGSYAWMEDEDYFLFADDILLPTGEKIFFSDNATYMWHTGGIFEIVDDTFIKLNAPQIRIGAGAAGVDYFIRVDGQNHDFNITFKEDEGYIEFDSDIRMITTENIYFRDTAIGINSSTDGQLDIFADVELQITAPTVDINASSEVNISNNLTVGGELTGSRVMVTGGKQGVLSASNYLVPGVGGTFIFSATEGWVAHRAGSITGISVITSATIETTQGNLTFEVRVNDTPVYTKVIASNGVTTVSGYDTQARGTDTFAAGDLISMYVTFTSFVGSIDNTAMMVELTLDT